MIFCVALICVKEGKLLLVKSKKYDTWYLPGGKVNTNENLKIALMRELHEELNIIVNEDELYYIKSSVAPTHDYGQTMFQHCFGLTNLSFIEQIEPSSEIEQLGFFSIKDYPKIAPAALLTLKEFTFQ